ncbi:metalloregulator ArsR/SmtB family transcription factor [Halobacteria archaeon AArc-curdl1]|uniref:Metalloregulator ArsR/SmtB family transcription factor n=1 Tax=Natronosalvus hydrolyticus TaxID=2979988 RepID=A0AAP2Z5Y9_9EURY|nr:metalloregulator ArsR/SmtB family transcription factor [Halobacteria archaeon AArc-curdl1]
MDTHQSNRTDIQSDLEGASCCTPVSSPLTERELAVDVRALSAIGNDTRYEALRIVAAAENDVCVCELEPALGVTQGAISQALSRLYGAGLVTRRKDGRWRYYSATPRAERLLDVLDETREVDDE